MMFKWVMTAMLSLSLMAAFSCTRAQDEDEKFTGEEGKGKTPQSQIPEAAKEQANNAKSDGGASGGDTSPFGDDKLTAGSQGEGGIGQRSQDTDLTEDAMDEGKIYVNGWDGSNDEIPPGNPWQVSSVAIVAIDNHGILAGQVDQNTGQVTDNTRVTPSVTPTAGGQVLNNANQNLNQGLQGLQTSGVGSIPNVEETADAVIFTIPKGTGRNAWNTQATEVVAKVGKKFILVNGDDVPHQWHTNGAPCQHGNLLQPGQRQECNPRPYSGPPLYDHNTRGQFFIKAR